MLTKEHVIEKIKILPEDVLREIDDFIDFLEIKRNKKGKRKKEWNWLSAKIDIIEESDFKEYLDSLTSYEIMLAKGEIKWK